MAVKKIDGVSRLKQDLKSGTYSSLYIISGEETYLKEFYLNELKKKVVDPNFADFNLVEFDGKGLAFEQLSEAIDSLPAMAEKKLITVTDFDIFKPPAEFSGRLPELLADIPEYVCLVFYYDVLEGKPDKRTKLYKQLEKTACFAEFHHPEDRELVEWIERRARECNCFISGENASYLIFFCGNSMSNLIGEIEKAASHSSTGEIKKYNIDSVCSPVLDAVVFDLTDAVTAGRFERAVEIVDELIRQKNSEVMIFTTLTRHIQRLYAAKLCEAAHEGEKGLMELIGSKSPYYARQIKKAASRVTLSWVREAASLCAKTDSELKGSMVDRQKQIELALLQMAASWREMNK